MWPDVLDLGFIRIQGYGLMILAGSVAAYLALRHDARRAGLPDLSRRLPGLLLWLAAAAFVGGKLLLWLLYPEQLRELLANPDWGTAMAGGFVFYGSLLACLAVASWRLRAMGLPVRKSFDVLILAAPLVHGFGRLGCFCAGCCHGYATECPLGVTFTRGLGLNGVAVHPVQLYEAAGLFAILGWLWFGPRKRKRFDGQLVLAYLVSYAVLRFAMEFLRGDRHAASMLGLTDAQLTSLALVVPATFLLWRGAIRA